ncbi:hypothetical protein [Corynebacterium accolens]|uniref:hypothetical protein n=1 Tax=Corynebacterium accolens TaxID=38284 RepID=UPI00266ED11C|nr:hypothetical protein [Corynebacterium accolens]WKS54936.1 hypothetical protein NLL31_06805 [Corynebacterium accolens]
MSPFARLAFIGMWNWADDSGRGTYNPRELMGFIFPHDENMTVADFRRLCAEIRAHVAVDFFEVAGRFYFEISSWKKHQSKHAKFGSSKYPGPDEGEFIDPVNMQVIGEVPEMCRNSATSARSSATSARGSAIGTGEQGNRGTGEKRSCSSGDEPGDLNQTDEREPELEPVNSYPENFERWWKLYPRKQGKRKALNEWRRAAKRVGRDELNSKTQRFADFHEREGTDRQFIPLATTWLARDGWDDELISRTRRAGRQEPKSKAQRFLDLGERMAHEAESRESQKAARTSTNELEPPF